MKKSTIFLSFFILLIIVISACSDASVQYSAPELPDSDLTQPEIQIVITDEEDAVLQDEGKLPLIEPQPTIDDTDTASNIEQPPFLTECLEKSSLCFDDLDCSQFILVSSENTSAMVFCYDCFDGQWILNKNISYLNGYVGKHGVNNNHIEGDGTTPAGFFNLGFAFGNKPNPGTELEYRDIKVDDYWVSDPESSLYNTWVTGTDGYNLSKAEHLIAYTNSYAYCVVIEYNMPDVIPYAGSAIFLHCGEMPTSGCVAVSECNMIEILKWLKPGAKILIL